MFPLPLYVTTCGPFVVAVAGVAPAPKSHSYVVLPVVPVEISVKVTVSPSHIANGVPEKFADNPQPCRVIDKICSEPTQPFAFVSITVISPFIFAKSTIISLLSGPVSPEVIVAPVGTVHAYEEPEVSIIL